MAATIENVAVRAGVAKSTVSKYMNGGTLRSDVRERVEQAVKELGYVPNDMARGLKNAKSFTVGVLIPTLSSAFSAGILSEMENVLQEHGYGMILCDCKGRRKEELEKLAFLEHKKVDAYVILSSTLSREDIAKIKKPVVLFDKPIEGAERDTILIDNYSAGYAGAEILLKNGHRDIAVLAGGREGVFTSSERVRGCLAAIRDYGENLSSERILHTDFTLSGAYQVVTELLESGKLPTAFFALNDDVTVGLVMALNRAGVSIPNEISVLGFDNLTVAKVSNPTLDIIYQPLDTLGRLIGDTVVERLNGQGGKPRTRVVDYVIYPGASIRTL